MDAQATHQELHTGHGNAQVIEATLPPCGVGGEYATFLRIVSFQRTLGIEWNVSVVVVKA